VISIEDLSVGYGSHPVQSAISARIGDGEIFAVVGDSGSGKSTLLRTMIGLMPPQSGRVVFQGASSFGVLFQNGALWTSMSVLENVMLPMDLQGDLPRAARRALARFKLALVGLAGDEDRYPASLSGGMRKRAGLARALALDPSVLFLDEPSAGLDPLASRRLDELVLSLRDGLGITVVLVTHELESLYRIAIACCSSTARPTGQRRSACRPSLRARPKARRCVNSCREVRHDPAERHADWHVRPWSGCAGRRGRAVLRRRHAAGTALYRGELFRRLGRRNARGRAGDLPRRAGR